MATYLSMRNQPPQWADELQAILKELTGLTVATSSDKPVSIELTDEQRELVTAWTERHGDPFDAVFRRDDILPPKVKPIGVTLKAGEKGSFRAPGVAEELRDSLIAFDSVKQVDGSTVIEGLVQRLVPDSGVMGRMGRYRFHLAIGASDGFEVVDPKGLGLLVPALAHYDPTCRQFYMGHPAFGSLTVTTDASDYDITLDELPTQVRRWRRWAPQLA